jgi:putative selenium metabolism protein SsnA
MLIKNAALVTWEEPNQILEDHAIWIENGRIADLGPSSKLEQDHPTPNPIDARGQLILPGNICAHTHYYGAFARGMAIPGDAPKTFPEILQNLWWKLDRTLTADDTRYSALICLVDAIKHGTTSLIDHHASPNAIDGSLDAIAEAVEQAGLRSVLCYEVSDRDGEAKMKAGVQENLRFIAKSKSHPLLRGTFGLHASLTLSDQTLDYCRSSASDAIGFHIHAAESDADQCDSVEKYQASVIERLGKHGILGKKSITAHCVHVSPKEIDLLAESGTWVTHQPRSNMNNGVGVAPVEDMLNAGVNVCLGNDGFSNAMWEEWKTAYLIHKVKHLDPRRMNGYDVIKMAVRNNARLIETFFPEIAIGSITKASAADLIFVDYQAPTPLTASNIPWHILFGFRETMITSTMVNGKFLMKDRQLLTIDEKEISAKANELAAKMWGRVI